jgi:hypothetical protein
MVGTIFESSHIGLDKWLLAFYLLCSSTKGMSAHQLHRMLGITYKSAWFMFHRIREAMAEDPFQVRMSGTVEVDETFIGGKPWAGQITGRKGKGIREFVDKKAKVVTLSSVTAARFDDAIKAALEVKPKGKVGNGKPAGKPRKNTSKR